jgi:DNA-binding response OmpR family regulator
MSTILVAAEASWVRDLVRSACTAPGQRVIEATKGQDVRDLVKAEEPELVVLDMQIANMGGVATSIDLRLEASAGRIPDTSILLLLDREADRFLAKRADADAELVKPVDPGTLRRTVERLLAAEEPVIVDDEADAADSTDSEAAVSTEEPAAAEG